MGCVHSHQQRKQFPWQDLRNFIVATERLMWWTVPAPDNELRRSIPEARVMASVLAVSHARGEPKLAECIVVTGQGITFSPPAQCFPRLKPPPSGGAFPNVLTGRRD